MGGTSRCGCWNLMRHYKYWMDIGQAYSEAKINELQMKFRSDVLKLVPSDPGRFGVVVVVVAGCCCC